MSIIKRPPQQFEPNEEHPHVRIVKGKKTIDQWIADRAHDPDKEGPLTSLVLENLVGTSATTLHVKQIGQAPIDPQAIGTMFFDIATTYCQDLSGNHLFRILAFYDGRPQPEARHIFGIAGQQDAEFLSQESPNKDGLLSHGLAYATKTMELALKQMREMQESTNETLRIVSSANSRLMTENFSAYEWMKNVMIDAALEKTNKKFEIMKYERATKERQKLLGMVPPLANRLLGKEVFPHAVEDTSLMEQIADLDEETLEDVAKLLQKRPSLMAMFTSRIEQLVDKKMTPNTSREEKVLGTNNISNELGEGEDE